MTATLLLAILSINAYDIAVLDRDIPGPTGDEIAERIVASGPGMPILISRPPTDSEDKASGFELGADDYLTKPFELRELVLEAPSARPPARAQQATRSEKSLALRDRMLSGVRSIATVATSRSPASKFAVLEILVAAEGGVVNAEELLERAWDEHADPFTNAVRITISALRRAPRRTVDHRYRDRRWLPRHHPSRPRQ